MTSADTYTALGLQDSKMTLNTKNLQKKKVDNFTCVYAGQANLDNFGVGCHTECDGTSKR